MPALCRPGDHSMPFWLRGLAPLCSLSHPFTADTSPTIIHFIPSQGLETRSPLGPADSPCRGESGNPTPSPAGSAHRPMWSRRQAWPLLPLPSSAHTQPSSQAERCDHRTRHCHPPQSARPAGRLQHHHALDNEFITHTPEVSSTVMFRIHPWGKGHWR